MVYFETYLVFLELRCSISFSTSFKEASPKENGVVTLMFLINKTLAWATYWSMPFSIVPACSLFSSLIEEFSFQKPRSQMFFKNRWQRPVLESLLLIKFVKKDSSTGGFLLDIAKFLCTAFVYLKTFCSILEKQIYFFWH